MFESWSVSDASVLVLACVMWTPVLAALWKGDAVAKIGHISTVHEALLPLTQHAKFGLMWSAGISKERRCELNSYIGLPRAWFLDLIWLTWSVLDQLALNSPTLTSIWRAVHYIACFLLFNLVQTWRELSRWIEKACSLPDDAWTPLGRFSIWFLFAAAHQLRSIDELRLNDGSLQLALAGAVTFPLLGVWALNRYHALSTRYRAHSNRLRATFDSITPPHCARGREEREAHKHVRLAATASLDFTAHARQFQTVVKRNSASNDVPFCCRERMRSLCLRLLRCGRLPKSQVLASRLVLDLAALLVRSYSAVKSQSFFFFNVQIPKTWQSTRTVTC